MISFRSLSLAAALSFAAASPSCAAPTPVVDTPAGQLQGQMDGTTRVYKGVHYALPPVGSARWKAPMPMPRWSGIKSATEYGTGVPAARLESPEYLFERSGRDERGLPDAEHLGAGRCAQCAGVLLDPWRRAVGRLEQRDAL